MYFIQFKSIIFKYLSLLLLGFSLLFTFALATQTSPTPGLTSSQSLKTKEDFLKEASKLERAATKNNNFKEKTAQQAQAKKLREQANKMK